MRRAAALLSILLLGCIRQEDEPSLISQSEDKAYRVTIVEHLGRMDRNFAIWVERMRDGYTTNIFESPDEGRPIGTERIIWNREHTQFVLVGREFFVENGPRIQIETPYLLYDLPSGKLWCNAAQRSAPRFTLDNLTNWTGSYENDVHRAIPSR